MNRRVGILILLVPLFLIAIHSPAVLGGTLKPLIIEEVPYFDEGLGAPAIQYRVTNPSGNTDEVPDEVQGTFSFNVIAFAVETGEGSSSSLGYGDTSVPSNLQYGTAWTFRDTWRAKLLNEESWNAGFKFGINPGEPQGDYDYNNYDHLWITGEGNGDQTGIGTWQENFPDIQAAQVAFYFDNDGVKAELTPGSTDDQFFWSSASAIALTVTGTYGIDDLDPNASLQFAPGTVIPLPSAAWMGLGLMGILAAVRRRRRTR